MPSTSIRNCDSLRDRLLNRLAADLTVASVGSACMVTIPVRTADDRYVDVYVEPLVDSGFVRVHDGGKSTAELYTQGIHLTNAQEETLERLARRYRVHYQEGEFTALVKEDAIYDTVMGIGQCASLAMLDVVSHFPRLEEEPISGRVSRALQEWKPPYVDIQRRTYVEGRLGGTYFFDFVSIPRKPVARTVAIKILPPSVGPMWQAKSFGFFALDIEGREESTWRKLSIITKADEWPDKAVEVVRKFSSDVLLVDSDREDRVETLLPAKMSALTEAA